jgi:lipid II:glycine glycyltransferase (peptidoglycan interpeptide bridge formation enzyme)
MSFIDINEESLQEFNSAVNHPLQTYEWGDFRKKTGAEVIRRATKNESKITDVYQITVHKTPNFPYQIGYFPKGNLPTEEILQDLKKIGGENFISFVQLEPNVLKSQVANFKFEDKTIIKSFHPLFTRFTFLLDLTKQEEDLLKNMHQKTRYNIKVAEKKGVKVEIDNSNKAFEDYIKLTKETTKRQKFYAHDEKYHRLMWETLGNKSNSEFNPNKLSANIVKATYKKKTLVTYILFTFKDKLYYPYGASSDEYREVMASTKTMWEVIKWGKSLGLKTFDMWGAANVREPKTNDPYYGFHRFKQSFGAELTEFMGSFDLVINPLNYRLLHIADKLRWAYLKTKKR